MKKFHFFYDGDAIPESQFRKVAPAGWEDDLDEYGNYSHGYYRAMNSEYVDSYEDDHEEE